MLTTTARRVLVLIALIIFVLAAFGVAIGPFAALNLVALGLAVWAASLLVP